jgi:putative ABC transport system permease protein
VLFLAISRTERLKEGVFLALGIAVSLAALWASAASVSRLARRLLSARWPYVVRQGVANLYRPANQTRAVTLALGFGAFLVTTIYLVQTNILREIDLGDASQRANVVFFDVQEDQAPSLDSIVRTDGNTIVERTPIVMMKIAAINGRTTAQLLADTAAAQGRPRRRRADWPLRREYRSTYRTHIVDSEKLVSGKWFADSGRAGVVPEVSLDREIATELGVSLGDTITWDVQGVKIATRLTSTREVNWARFQPNFFAVFQPAAISSAPKQFVFLAHVPTPEGVARVQRDIVRRHPNVSSVDLSLVQRTIGGIVDKVSVAVRFLAVFCLAMGVPVLFSAVAATRRDRLREGVLLKVLGATRSQIRRILLAEYLVLGAIGALAGMLLSFGGAWALVKWVFEGDFAPAWGPAAAIAAAMMALTVGIGLLTGREVFKETPMAAIRDV